MMKAKIDKNFIVIETEKAVIQRRVTEEKDGYWTFQDGNLKRLTDHEGFIFYRGGFFDDTKKYRLSGIGIEPTDLRVTNHGFHTTNLDPYHGMRTAEGATVRLFEPRLFHLTKAQADREVVKISGVWYELKDDGTLLFLTPSKRRKKYFQESLDMLD